MEIIRLDFNLQQNVSLFEPTTRMIWGDLILTKGNSKIKFMASSGLPGFQSLSSSTVRRKGRLPSCKQANINHYNLDLIPINLPNVIGVNGLFYKITPFQVNVGNLSRSDLGIHLDTNVEGSSGCIVIKQLDHWEIFKSAIKLIALTGIKSIPVYVY